MATQEKDRYNAAVQLHNQEFRTLGERTNAFLIGQSILVVALVTLLTSFDKFPLAGEFFIIGISLVGGAFCFFHHISGMTGANAAFKWRQYMRHIENPIELDPWVWFYNHRQKCESFLLRRAPLPHTWIIIPAIFSLIWFFVSMYIRARLHMPNDPVTEDLFLSLCVTQLISNIASGITSFVMLSIVLGSIFWCCKKQD